MPAAVDPLPRQVNCHQTVRINASADAVWAVVGDIGSLVPGGAIIERIDVEGAGAGAIRTLHLPGGARVIERIEDHDPVLRRYVYHIIDCGPLDCAQYRGAAEVTQAGPDACILSWSAMANPIGAETDALRSMIEANLDHALRAVANHCQSPTA